jgi:LytS/YehU family sensor histidine kinase
MGIVVYGILNQLPQEYFMTSAWVILVIVFLWAGNSVISTQLDRVLPWLKYGTIRFLAQLFFGLLYSLFIVNLSYLIFKQLFTVDPPTTEQLAVMNIYGALIILPTISIYFGFQFLRSWRKSEIEAEKFQKESIRSQLEALKNHLDPHFLFNNLNILSSLIDRSTEQSKEFLDRFAEVYRFILQNEGQELVSLEQELAFVDAYLYLLKTRFEDMIEFKVSIPENKMLKNLPPLTLQMLIENVIKHNFVTETKPLEIDVMVSENGKILTVRNNLQVRNIPHRKGERSGLKNIMSRYSYYTDQEVKTNNDGKYFTVEVPLLAIV